MIKKLELVSKPGEVHLGRLYTEESYIKAKNSKYIKKLFKYNMFYLLDFDLGVYDYKSLAVDLRYVIGKVEEWQDDHIVVDVFDEYVDKYDWDNCKAGMYMLCNTKVSDEAPYTYISDIKRVLAFHILTPREQKKIS